MNKFLHFMIFQFMFFVDGDGTPGFGGSPMEGNNEPQGSGTPDPTLPPSDDTPGTPAYQYPETLDQSYHGNKSLIKFANEDGSFDYGKLSQSYIQLEQHLGKDKMPIPGEQSSAEDWKSAFTKMGLPESLENYALENTLPEGYEADNALIDGFKAVAYEANILPHQSQAVMNFFNEFSIKGIEAKKDAQAASVAAGMEALKTEWGESYEGRAKNANDALSQFATKEDIQAMSDAGMLTNPAFFKVFDQVAKGLGEESFTPPGGGTFGMSPDDIDMEIAKLQQDPAHQQTMHPQHEAAINKMMVLLRKKHGNKEVAAQ